MKPTSRALKICAAIGSLMGLFASASWAHSPPAGCSPVSLRLGDGSNQVSSGTTLVQVGGGFGPSTFPAISADGDRVSVLYHALHPMIDGYPTLEVFSTTRSVVVERIDLHPRDGSASAETSLADDDVTTAVRQNIVRANEYLAAGRFRSMKPLFDFLLPEWKFILNRSMERDGLAILHEATEADPGRLIIREARGGRVLLEAPMKQANAEAEDPDNSCISVGSPDQGWFDPVSRIIAIRIRNVGSQDGCDAPDEWLITRLDSSRGDPPGAP